MIYTIENKKINVTSKNETIALPAELKEKIQQNFETMKRNGANIWNGEVLCVSECNIQENEVQIICKKSDYAHYLYGERIGIPQKYECKNLSAGCLLETIDGHYIVGELDDTTSYPTMLQVTGGGIDKKDIIDGTIRVEQTIRREALEELNLDLNNQQIVLNNRLSYLYVSEENEPPGVEIFSKARIKMTAREMEAYFNNYYQYLKQNHLEVEFKRLHFFKKGDIEEGLKKLDNPRRNYLLPLLKMDWQREQAYER